MLTQLNLLMLGDRGCGKTTFVTRHATGDFVKDYKPTSNEDYRMTKLDFCTDSGQVIFVVYECCSVNHIPAGVTFDCIMLMYDVAVSKLMKDKEGNDYDGVDKCKKYVSYTRSILKDVMPKAPIVVIGNKCDLANTQKCNLMSKPSIKLTDDFTYFVSAKSNYNFEKPWLYLARCMLNDVNLQFISWPAITPPSIELTPELSEQLAREQQDALTHGLVQESDYEVEAMA